MRKSKKALIRKLTLKERHLMLVHRKERQLTQLSNTVTALVAFPAGHSLWSYWESGQVAPIHFAALGVALFFKWVLTGEIQELRYLLEREKVPGNRENKE